MSHPYFDPRPTSPPPVPPPAAPRRRWPLPVALGALLLAGAVAAGVAVTSDGADPAAAELDTLFLTAGDPAADPTAAGDRDRKQRSWRRLAQGEHVVAGAVASSTDTSIVVTRDGGASVTVPADGDTVVAGARNRATTDLDAGERVLIKVGTDGVADRVLTVRAHAAGTVTAVDGERVTVVRAGGLSVTLDLSGVDARPAVGTVVIAIGSAAADGSVLVTALREVPTLG